MINFISNLFRVARTEVRNIKLDLYYVIFWTILGVGLLLVFRPTVESSFLFTFIPWIASFILLFSVNHLINIHVAGEGLEFASALTGVGTTEDTKETTLLENVFSDMYWSAIKGIFLAQSILFLMLPLYINYTAGGNAMAIAICMVSVVIAISAATFFKMMFGFLSLMTVLAYCFGGILILFPPIAFQFNHFIGNKINFSSIEAYKIANETESIRAGQRESKKIEELKRARDWQRNNPCQELPQYYKQTVEEIGRVVAVSDTKSTPEKRIASNSTSSSSSNEELEMRVRRIYGK
ncbi:MAG: hypothetical protein WCI36_02090 [bacterium]